MKTTTKNKTQPAFVSPPPPPPKAAEDSNPSALVRRPTLFYFRSTFKFLIWIDYGGVGVAAAEIMNALGEGELKHY